MPPPSHRRSPEPERGLSPEQWRQGSLEPEPIPEISLDGDQSAASECVYSNRKLFFLWLLQDQDHRDQLLQLVSNWQATAIREDNEFGCWTINGKTLSFQRNLLCPTGSNHRHQIQLNRIRLVLALQMWHNGCTDEDLAALVEEYTHLSHRCPGNSFCCKSGPLTGGDLLDSHFVVESGLRNMARRTHHNGSARCNCTVPCLANPGYEPTTQSLSPSQTALIAASKPTPSLSTSDSTAATFPHQDRRLRNSAISLLALPGVTSMTQWLSAHQSAFRTPNKDAISIRIRDLKASHAALQPGTIDELCVALWELGRMNDPIGVINQTLGFAAWAEVEKHLGVIPRRAAILMTDAMVDVTGNARRVCQQKRTVAKTLLETLEGMSVPTKSFALLQMPEGFINNIYWKKVPARAKGAQRYREFYEETQERWDNLAVVEGYEVFDWEEFIKTNVTSPSIVSMNFQLKHGLIDVVDDSDAPSSD